MNRFPPSLAATALFLAVAMVPACSRSSAADPLVRGCDERDRGSCQALYARALFRCEAGNRDECRRAARLLESDLLSKPFPERADYLNILACDSDKEPGCGRPQGAPTPRQGLGGAPDPRAATVTANLSSLRGDCDHARDGGRPCLQAASLLTSSGAREADTEDLLAKGCKQGLAKGCTVYGLRLYQRKDTLLALDALQRACELGSLDGCSWGGFVAKERADFPRAGSLYARACQSETADELTFMTRAHACTGLGRLIEKKQYQPADLQTTPLALYTRACDLIRHPQGCFNRGAILYGEGKITEAIVAWGWACFGGEADGCSDLGEAAEKGFAGSPNPRRALIAYSQGCQLGSEECCTSAERLRHR